MNAVLIKKVGLILLVLHCCMTLHAQFLPADEIFYRTSRQSILCPPEKVYLHTDRNVYIAGDTIWMKAYVVDGIAHVPMKLSQYVYVTLQNPFLENVVQVKLKADKEGFIYGHIPLPDNLPKGEYSLCAYTQYMTNFDNEYFFKKRITVNSVMNKSIRMEAVQRGRNLDISFVNPITGEIQNVRNCAAKLPSGDISILHEGDAYRIKFHNTKEKVVLIQAGNYQEFVNVDVKDEYDVSFLPEGGNLVTGTFNRVAFKCINSSGQGEDVVGTLRDERDSILLEFKSLYRGMGTLSFIPAPGKKYTAVCENIKGYQKRFELPASTDKYTMQVNQIRDKVYVKVLFSPYNQHDEKLLVIAHQRGWPVKIGKWRKKTPGLVCNHDDFIEGVASFLLVNELGQIVSERMIFIQKDKPLEGKLHTENPIPGKREKVKLSLKVSEKWWNGDCSVSVTDNQDARPDSCDNILSSLLLSADLRGYVESPAWYFQKDANDSTNLRLRALDALMMTQGWRKYDFRKAWAQVYKEPALLPETSQQITGKVTSRVKRTPIGEANVQLMLPLSGVKEETKTTADGTFLFNGFDAPDSTVFWLSAFTEKGKSNVVLELDTIVRPVLNAKLPPYRSNTNLVNKEYFSSMTDKADYRSVYEKGIRHLFLDEVLVTASKIKPMTEYEKVPMGKSIKEKDIAQSGTIDMHTLLQQKVPGIQMGTYTDEEGESHSIIALRNTPILVIVDDVVLNPLITDDYENMQAIQIINSLNKEDIAQIDVIRGGAFVLAYHSKATGGLMAITTKRGAEGYNAQWGPTNLKTIMPLGFQQPVEFYSPRYELTSEKEKSTPDLRTTIHWQPRLKVKNGKVDVEFYTADGLVDYSVVIEGIGKDGSLLRVEETIGGKHHE